MTESRFVVRDAAGTVVDPVLPESLHPFLLDRAGTPGERVALTEHEDGADSAEPRRSAVAEPEPDGGWRVRVDHDGGIVARAVNTDAVYDLLRSWAADDDWWLEAFGWERG
ncbi:hypothetical protein FHX74_001905 [Friedmanniella endophytica]|uniref:Uncharacterized protein n=1 Tax=Microlunatus kandeliicorticis TaxID=1759536 RepID=A0A7W3IS79_9ACTN|nr:hypothetical protein [Microlunatus kandeliicorticis]MBA8794286.1 hypothetical protein [Microlunatus kandeliicorticis]